MTSQNATRGIALRAAALTATAVSLMPLAARPALAQNKPAPNGSILLFPAVVDPESAKGESAKLASEVVTDALRSRLRTLGYSVVIYSSRLPSIQRAREEQQVRKGDDDGPGDDRRKAQKLADIVGAGEYLSVFVDGYSFNADTRTATFNLNVNRYLTSDGTPIGTFNRQQQGIAPADVAVPRREGSSIARAMDAGADQSLGNLYPAIPIREMAKPPKRKRTGLNQRQATVLFGAALGVLYFSTR